MPKRLTLTEIAALSGVSRQVVSAVVNPDRCGTVRYSKQTSERVQAIVGRTGFRLNRTARNLVRNRHGCLGILIREYGLVWGDTLRHILAAAHDNGQVVVLDYLPDNPAEMPSIVKEDAVDGILLFEDIDGGVLAAVDRLGVPCVRINTNARTVPGAITFDELGAMRMAVDHFVARGRRTLAICVGSGGHYSQRLRKKGFQLAARAAGLAPVSTVFLDRSPAATQPRQQEYELERLLTKRPDIDAVVLTQDRMAPHFYRCAARLGRRIPGDIAVIGVNNSPVAQAVTPELTSLYVKSEEVGTRAVQMLNDQIRSGDGRGGHGTCAYHLIQRDST